MAKKNFITCDGNYAAANIAYMFSEVAAIYPITPSSTMAEYIDEWAANGRKNVFGETVKVSELQSEGGASGSVHGSLQAGALTSTFTASQGLLLMIPNMYKIAGELLPGVFHVSARSVASHALSIFGDHNDIYATRQTGFAQLSSGSVQEAMDMAGVAHLAAIKTRIPFLHFFDGFRTSHEIQKVEAPTTEQLAGLLDWDAVKAFRKSALNPENPMTRGTAQNPDIYFQAKEASQPYYDAVADVVAHYMDKISAMTGRTYKPFAYYGAEDAQYVTIAMGSVTDTMKEVVDYLVKKGEKVGMISAHLYRPFSEKYFFAAMPETARFISVMDRTKEPGAGGDPLYLDVRNAYYGKKDAPVIVGGRYGLSSKDTTPAQIMAIYDNLKQQNPKDHFTVGIKDDVNNSSLELKEEVNTTPEGTFQGKFYGLGSDGTVGANKNSIKIIGDSTDKYAQGYFAYDSKKSGGITISHLRFGDHPIRSTYYVNNPDFVACHVPAYLEKYDMLEGLKKGGTFLLNSIWDEETTKEKLPDSFKRYMADNDINFYIINATRIAKEIGLGNRTNTIMQSAFFKIAEVIPFDQAMDYMKKAIVKSFGRKGEHIVNMNYAAVDKGAHETHKVEVPAEWKSIEPKAIVRERKAGTPDFIKNVVDPINHLRGDELPVSTFKGREDGAFPAGTAAYEKRGIAVEVPEWQADTCIQCNECALACPHAVIRPFLLSDQEKDNAPEGMVTVPARNKKLKGYHYSLQISPLDCTGCYNCVDVCPTKEKSLVMKPLETQEKLQDVWDWTIENVPYRDNLQPKDKTIIASQFARPYLEFSGACAGCGETPYVKLVTQLFGDRMMIANATGCSSIWGGSAPSTPYTKDDKGRGPAWANSLFEDNAEYGFGMSLGVNKMRDRIKLRMEAALSNGIADGTKAAFEEWIAAKDDAEKSKVASEKVIEACKKDNSDVAKEILELKQYLIKKSIWMVGGDGWAYDIGYGGLDHVLASGDDVNVFVLDTEVYSNTGGQSSKASPLGSVAKFAAAGKQTKKKDLGRMAMSYGYVYVAQIGMGANKNQTLKAIREAEAYKGPSLIIAYAPCIAHGLKSGMESTQTEIDNAVKSGFWHLYRYNPELEAKGKNPFQLDSKAPDWSKFQEFLAGEVRYTALKKTFPEVADKLFAMAEENAKWRYDSYKRLAEMEYKK